MYGMLCGFVAMDRIRFSPTAYKKSMCRDWLVPFSAALLAFSGIILSTLFLFSGDGVTAPCPACQKLSCMEFPPWGADNQTKWWYCDSCGQASGRSNQSLPSNHQQPNLSIYSNILCSADAHIDDESGYYDYLNMLCPNGTTVYIDLGSDATFDHNILRENLPNYCRMNCQEGRYAF